MNDTHSRDGENVSTELDVVEKEGNISRMAFQVWLAANVGLVSGLLLMTTEAGFDLVDSQGLDFDIYLLFLWVSVLLSAIQIIVVAVIGYRIRKNDRSHQSTLISNNVALLGIATLNLIWIIRFLWGFYQAMSSI